MRMISAPLSPWETLGLILAVAAGAALTRFAPFWLFPESRKVPAFVSYLGNALPPAMMGLLVVYCLRNADAAAAPHALPEAGGILIIALLHAWKGNALLSIAGGTGAYMALLRLLG